MPATRSNLSAEIPWTDPALDEACRAWARQAMAVVEQDATLGRYANVISAAGPDVTRSIYGEAKLARLADLKRTWDPDNVFHLNHNVAPALTRGPPTSFGPRQ
jgi:FAD/FMN-containing dehydrogenase